MNRVFRSLGLMLCCAPLLMGATVSLTYDYDAAGRLTRVDYGDGRALVYTYGPGGELLQRSVEGEWPAEPTPDPDPSPAPEAAPEAAPDAPGPGDAGETPDAVAPDAGPDGTSGDGGGCGGCQGGSSGGSLALALALLALAAGRRARALALSVVPLGLVASLPAAPAAATPLTIEGSFAVQVYSDGAWRDVGRMGFDAMPRTSGIDLAGIVPSGKTTLRIVQRGGHAAHLDAVTLGGQAAISVDGASGAKRDKLAAPDHDVLHTLGRTLELRFPAERGGDVLALTARIEGARICPRPFVFGPFEYALGESPGPLVVDGQLTEVAGSAPFFQAWAEAGTGHPSSWVYGWVRNDLEALYVALDFTGDNTIDGDADYASVTVRAGDREETFTVSSGQLEWGVPGFTYTDQVGYQHKVYELAIPLTRLEQDPFDPGAPLELHFTLYGTCGPEFQDPDGNCCPPEEKDADGYCIMEPVDPPDPTGPIFTIKNLYGTFHHVAGVNDQDNANKVVAVGYSMFETGILTSSDYRATMWHAGVTTGLSAERNLGNSDPAQNLPSRALDVNDAGQVVGWFDIEPPGGALERRAFTLTPPAGGLPWVDTTPNDGMNDLPLQVLDLGLGEDSSRAVAINNAGSIVGRYSSAAFSGSRAFLHSGGVASQLALPPGGVDAWASAISETGIVGGASNVEVLVASEDKKEEPQKVPITHPVLWSGAAPEDLGVPCKLCGAEVLDVNDSGWAVGTTKIEGYASKYNAIWLPQEAAGLEPGFNSFGIGPAATAKVRTIGINNKGQVVGGLTLKNGQRRAFLWLPEPGYAGLPAGMHWLEDLIPKISGFGELVGQSTHALHYAVDINDEGLIIAYGQQRNIDCGQFQCAFYVSLVPTGNEPLPEVPKPEDPFKQTAAEFDKSVTDADPVNTWTGELVLEPEPALVSGPLSLQRFYSTSVGWRHGYQWSLYEEPSDAGVDDEPEPAIATVLDYQGARLQFEASGGGWAVADPDKEGHQLVETAGGFAYLQPEPPRLMRFDQSGRLTEVGDTRGYLQTLSYADGRLASVSDSRGGGLTFAYDDEGRLGSVTDHLGRAVAMTWEGDALTAFTDVLGQTTTYEYGPSGGLSAVVRPAGNTPYTQAYTPSGSRVVSQTDAYGHTMSFDYASEGLTTLMTDALDQETRHAYSQSGALLAHVDRLGHETSLSYDDLGRLSGEANAVSEAATLTTAAGSGRPATVGYADGTELTFSWVERPSTAADGLVHYDPTSRTYPDGTSEQLGYDDAGRLTSLTDQAGHETTFTWDAQGQLETSTNPLGGVTTRTWDALGRLASLTTAHGHVVTHAYDDDEAAGGLVETISYSAGETERTLTWDARRQLSSVVDEAGQTTSFGYDANGNLTSVTNPLGHTALYRYDLMDRIEEFEDGAGGVTHVDYDALGRIAAITDPNGITHTFAYDAEGRLTELTDGGGRVWRRTYDAAGRQLSLIDPLGNPMVTYAYDATGSVASVTDALGESMAYVRDAMGRILEATDPRGHTTSTSYEPRGLPAGADMPGDLSAAYTWDALGQLTEVVDAAGETWRHAYDAQGLVTAVEDPLGREKTIEYDGFDRIAAVTYPDGSVQRTSYDARGYVVEQSYYADADATAAELTHTFSYDAAGQLVGGTGLSLERDPNGAIVGSNGLAMQRDPGGRLTSVTFAPGKTVTYGYEGDKLVSVSDWTGQGPVTFDYDDAGREIAIVRPNGVTTAFTYDAAHRVSGIVERRGETTLSSIALTRDAAGATTSAERELPPLSPPPLPEVSLAVDAARQIAAFEYDARGRRVSDDRTTYSFDGADRLVGVGEVELAYDARGRLIERSEAGGPTETFVWNEGYGLPSVSILRRDGEDAVYYVHTPTGELLYRIAAGDDAPSYYHCDELGSTVALTDAQGAVTDAWAYGPFGEPLGRSGSSDERFTFHGCLGAMREGEGGLYHMRQRVYDSRTTAFLSRDPVLSVGPITSDPYQFARRNPLHYVDPTGEQPYGLKNDDPRYFTEKMVLVLVEPGQTDGFGGLAQYYRKELLKRGYGSYFADSYLVAKGKLPSKYVRRRISGVLTIGHSSPAVAAGINMTRMEKLFQGIARAKGSETASLNAMAFWGCNTWHFINNGRSKFYPHLRSAAIVGYDTPATAPNKGIGKLKDGFATPLTRDPFLDHLEKNTPGEYVISDVAGAGTNRAGKALKQAQQIYEGRASLFQRGGCATGSCTPD